jgi:hypothetical protein
VQVEVPVSCGDCSPFHCRATAVGMLSAPLAGHEVVQMDQPSQECLLAPGHLLEAAQAFRRALVRHHASGSVWAIQKER